MKRSASALAAAALAAGVLLIPAAQAAAGQFHTAAGALDDFDCDGFSDTVYLAHYYDVGDARGAGAIIVYRNSGGEQTISQNTPGVPGTTEIGDSFGEVYASADFNGDGCDELIVAAPYEDVDGAESAGIITIINGSPNGLVPAQSVAYTQNTAGVPDAAEEEDAFGVTLVAGATSSGQAYLIAGSPGESVGGPLTDNASADHLGGYGTYYTQVAWSPILGA